MSKKSRQPQRKVSDGAPIRIVGRDAEDTIWVATRQGEPSFTGVQDLGDAISASSTRGDVAILVRKLIYEQMCSYGDAWYPVNYRVEID